MSGAPCISVSGLTKEFSVYKKPAGLRGSLQSLWHREYRTVHAVSDITFEIHPGEVVGFIGQNGAGKTTTLKVLSGLLYPSSGTVSVLGHSPWKRERSFQKQFSLVLGQKSQLWMDLPPMETFLLNQAIYEIPEKDFKKTLSTLVELLDVSEVLQVQVRKLSLGQRMKCELIASLLHQPKVLFLDEPTIGLDVIMQKHVRDFIKSYNKEFGATIILTSHYMADVKELCKRAIVIDQGTKIFDGEFSKLMSTYAPYKVLSLVFSEPVTKKELTRFGTVTSFTPLTATVLVQRSQATANAAAVLTHLPVQDVTIEEQPIEAVIREVFATQAGKMTTNE